MTNTTAMVSCFVRAYHVRNNTQWVFRDELAERMLTPEEYAAISSHMAEGISYFAPNFTGSKEAGLRYIVDRILAPSVLARSACNARMMERELAAGCTQYVSFAAGYDTTGLTYSGANCEVYELDLSELLEDKKRRIQAAGLASDVVFVPCDLAQGDWVDSLCHAGFDTAAHSCGSLLGISYYLSKAAFGTLLSRIGTLWGEGSTLCLDYPTQDEGDASRTNRALAKGAGEEMQACYTCEEMHALLKQAGFAVREEYGKEEADAAFFAAYNAANPVHPMCAPAGVRYCVVEKQG